jgi:hypothetical protein
VRIVANVSEILRRFLTEFLSRKGITVAGHAYTPDRILEGAGAAVAGMLNTGFVGNVLSMAASAVFDSVLLLALMPYLMISGPRLAAGVIWQRPRDIAGLERCPKPHASRSEWLRPWPCERSAVLLLEAFHLLLGNDHERVGKLCGIERKNVNHDYVRINLFGECGSPFDCAASPLRAIGANEQTLQSHNNPPVPGHLWTWFPETLRKPANKTVPLAGTDPIILKLYFFVALYHCLAENALFLP